VPGPCSCFIIRPGASPIEEEDAIWVQAWPEGKKGPQKPCSLRAKPEGMKRLEIPVPKEVTGMHTHTHSVSLSLSLSLGNSSKKFVWCKPFGLCTNQQQLTRHQAIGSRTLHQPHSASAVLPSALSVNGKSIAAAEGWGTVSRSDAWDCSERCHA
jgi:hypothetical protein